MASTRGLFCLVLAACSTLSAQEKAYKSELYWRQQAIDAVGKVQDARTRDGLLNAFCAGRCQAGDPEAASEDAAKIQDSQLRLLAHIKIAKHYSGRGQNAKCVAELKKAEAVALKDTFRFQLVDAYLDTVGDPKLAVAYAKAAGKKNAQYVAKTVVDDLADRGYFAEADDFVNWLNVRGLRKPKLYGQIARGAVKKGDVAGTQLVINKLPTERERDSLRLQLVKILMEEEREAEARKIAATITSDNYSERATTVIKDSQKPVTPSKKSSAADWLQTAMRSGGSGQRRDHLFGEGVRRLILSGEFVQAEAGIRSWIKAAKASPIQETTGQFGPYNQESRLLTIELHYAKLGLARAKAGEIEAAKKDLARVKPIAHKVGSSFILSLTAVPELLSAYVELGDIAAAKELLDGLPKNQWIHSAAYVVELLFRQGDRDGAISVAKKAAGLGGTCEVLIHNGEVGEVRQLMQAESLGQDLQQVAVAMMGTGRAATLKEWFDGLESDEDRAFMSVGAYLAIGTGTRKPQTDQEKAVCKWLSSVAEIDGVTLRRWGSANPGVYRPEALGQTSRVLGRQVVRPLSVSTVFVQHLRMGQLDVACYEFEDERTSQRIYDAMSEGQRELCLVRGRFFIRSGGRFPTEKLRRLIYADLAKKKLGT